jgi:curved DNA-binding protein CbpA
MIKLKTLIFESLSPIEAEQIFRRYGIPNASSLSKDELKKAWRELSKSFHPDKNPLKKDEMNLAMQWINSAYSVLNNLTQSSSNKYYNSNNVYQREEPDDYEERQRQRKERYQSWRQNHTGHKTNSGWAQAGWNGGIPYSDHIYNEDFHDLNFCKKTAWEISGKPPFDNEHTYTIINWDGNFQRGTFSVYAIPEKLFEISKMMQIWDNHFQSIAVFFQRKQDHVTYLVNLRGQEVNPPKEFEDFDMNDNQFREYLRKNL